MNMPALALACAAACNAPAVSAGPCTNVPVAMSMAVPCGLFRANALERVGQLQAAVDQITALAAQRGQVALLRGATEEMLALGRGEGARSRKWAGGFGGRHIV